MTGIAEPMDFNGFESIVSLNGSGSYRLDFTATTDQYVFEILGISDSMGYKPEIAYSIDNFSFNLLDIDSTELLWNIGFDSLPEDIYSYIVEEDDTLSMGIISYDTIENRLRVNLLEDEAPEYVGILMKDVVLEADRYYRFRPTISVISTSNDLTGVMALTRDHSESNIRDMKIFDVNQASEMIFYSDSGGLQTLLLGVVGDSSTYYYVDSLSLELLEMSISELYSNDFSTSAAGWRSKFADSLELTAGRIDWQSEEETMRIWPWGNDVGVIGSVVREIDVEPGIYNMVMAKVTLPDHPNAKVSLGVYDELAANVNFSTLSVEPMAHAVAEDFEETILYFSFRPNTDKMSLVMMYQSAEFGRVLLDDVKVISIEPYDRDTLLSMTFDDTSGVYNDWRSSIWPDSLINDSIVVSYISHDTAVGRMRVEVVEDPFEEDIENYVGVVHRRLSGLQVDKEYELSYQLEQGEAGLRKMQVMLIPQSSFELGMLNPTEHLFIDSTEIGDSISLRFTATQSDMNLLIIGESGAADNYYYIDNFGLKEGFVKTVNCDRSNLQLADQESRYRFGFNGMEAENEIYKNGGYDFGARIYDGRSGRFLSTDPLASNFAMQSPYVFAANSPILFIDKDGEIAFLAPLIWAGVKWGGKRLAIGMLSDIAVQLAVERYFGGAHSWTDAYENLDIKWGQAVASGAENLIKNKHASAFVSAMGDMVDEVIDKGGDVTAENLMIRGGAGLASSYFAKGMGNMIGYISKYGWKNVKAGLKEMGLSETLIKSLKPCGCFADSTQILTNSGYKAIVDVAIGDSVWAYNDSLNISNWEKVIDTYIIEWNEIYVIYANKEQIETTHEHPFYINNSWVKAEDIRKGDTLTSTSNQPIVVDSVQVKRGDYYVYNLLVENSHTYYVSSSEILVHNGKPCPISWQPKGGIFETGFNTKKIHANFTDKKGRRIGEVGFWINEAGDDILVFPATGGMSASQKVDAVAYGQAFIDNKDNLMKFKGLLNDALTNGNVSESDKKVIPKLIEIVDKKIEAL